MRVLIADNSDLLRNRIKDALKIIVNVGFVDEAKNGLTALQMIHKKNPDLVILDISMPKLSGIKVLEKLKELGSKCKIFIFTNYPYPQYKQKCLAEGADYFFNKNEDFQDLVNKVDNLAHQLSLSVTEQNTGGEK